MSYLVFALLLDDLLITKLVLLQSKRFSIGCRKKTTMSDKGTKLASLHFSSPNFLCRSSANFNDTAY